MNLNRVLSSLVVVAYVAFALVHAGAKLAFVLAIGLLLPLGCIWFSEDMGRYCGWMAASAPITYPTPGKLVLIMGWILLLLPIVLELIIHSAA
jgi:hypothetical protein